MSDYVQTSLGRTGLGLIEGYSPTRLYMLRDVVHFGGNAYVVARNEVLGITPSNDIVNYRMLVAGGTPGSSNAVWHTGANVEGQGTGIVAGVIGSAAGDMYLNSETSDLYRATAPDTWNWVMRLADKVTLMADDIATDAPGVSVQDALDSKLPRPATATNGAVAVFDALRNVAAGTAQNVRNWLGLGNTTGPVPAANGGTGSTALDGASGLLSKLFPNGIITGYAIPLIGGNYSSNGLLTPANFKTWASIYSGAGARVLSGSQAISIPSGSTSATVSGISLTAGGFTQNPMIVVSPASPTPGYWVGSVDSVTTSSFAIHLTRSNGSTSAGTGTLYWIAIQKP